MQHLLLWWTKTFQDYLRIILFFTFVFFIDRIVFLFFFSSHWDFPNDPVLESLWLGTRFSLKSAFIPAIGAILLGRVPQFFWQRPRLELYTIRYWIYLCLLVTSFLFIGRFPFYKNYQNNYNSFIFQGEHESILSLIVSVGDGLTWLLLFIGVILSFCTSAFLWRLWEKIPYFQISYHKKSFYYFVILFLSIALVTGASLLSRYGGAFRSANKLQWENIAQLPNHFLNELILDEYQALIRARDQQGRMVSDLRNKYTPSEMKKHGQVLAKNFTSDSNSWDYYLAKQSKGAKIPPPKQIFIILSESYGQWPLTPQYKNWDISNKLRQLTTQSDTYWLHSFLPEGMFTHYGMIALVSGVNPLAQSATYLPESYKEPFSTALAPQMKRLGYQSNFWYGGPGSWLEIANYTKAQGFNSFYGSGELHLALDNAWGIDDKKLFDQILERLSPTEPTVNVILTTSNHPPFSINVSKEGLDLNKFRANFPKEISENKEIVNKLAHFWYADQELGAFIEKASAKYPDSLFFIMGDHSTRIEIEGNFSFYDRISIPLIIKGNGITPALFPEENSGSQLQIIPTMIELIAPKGFEYFSLLPSLTEVSPSASNFDWWLTSNKIGKRENDQQQIYRQVSAEKERDIATEEAIIAFSWWRLNRGKALE